MALRISLTTPPATEPVTTLEAREHCRVDGSGEDDYLDTLIEAARLEFERLTGRALINQTWTWALDRWPSNTGKAGDDWWSGVRDGAISMFDASFIELPKPPLVSITSVTTYDTAGAGTVWSAASYQVDAISQPGRLSPVSGASWPQATRPLNGILIVFVAGYGAAASAVPIDIRRALLAHVAHAYEKRGDDSADSDQPALFARAVARYKLRDL